VIAQPARPSFEKDARLIREQCRQRILATPGRFEQVPTVDFASLGKLPALPDTPSRIRRES